MRCPNLQPSCPCTDPLRKWQAVVTALDWVSIIQLYWVAHGRCRGLNSATKVYEDGHTIPVQESSRHALWGLGHEVVTHFIELLHRLLISANTGCAVFFQRERQLDNLNVGSDFGGHIIEPSSFSLCSRLRAATSLGVCSHQRSSWLLRGWFQVILLMTGWVLKIRLNGPRTYLLLGISTDGRKDQYRPRSDNSHMLTCFWHVPQPINKSHGPSGSVDWMLKDTSVEFSDWQPCRPRHRDSTASCTNLLGDLRIFTDRVAVSLADLPGSITATRSVQFCLLSTMIWSKYIT